MNTISISTKYLHKLKSGIFISEALAKEDYIINKTLQSFIDKLSSESDAINKYLLRYSRQYNFNSEAEVINILLRYRQRRDNKRQIYAIGAVLLDISSYINEREYLVTRKEIDTRLLKFDHDHRLFIHPYKSKAEIEQYCRELDQDAISGFREILSETTVLHPNVRIWWIYTSEEIFQNGKEILFDYNDIPDTRMVVEDLPYEFYCKPRRKDTRVTNTQNFQTAIRKFKLMERLGIEIDQREESTLNTSNINELLDQLELLQSAKKFGILNYSYYKDFFISQDLYAKYIDENGKWSSKNNKSYVFHFVLFLELITNSPDELYNNNDLTLAICDDFDLFSNIDSRNASKKTNRLRDWRKPNSLDKSREAAKQLIKKFNSPKP